MIFLQICSVICSISFVYSSPRLPAVPGVDALSMGFDLNRLDLFPSAGNTIDGRSKNVLFEYTYDQGKYWIHPSLNITYRLPDQVAKVFTITSGTIQLTSHVHKTLHEETESWGVHVGREISAGPVSGGASASYKHSVTTTLETKTISAEMRGFLTTEKIALVAATEIQPCKAFKNAYAKLAGQTYENNPDPFDVFFENYGTHYFTLAHYGGSVAINMNIFTKYASKKTESQISVDVKASVAGLGGFDAGADYKNSKADSDFEENRHIDYTYYGGGFNPALGTLDNAAVQEWQTMVQKDPWQIGGLIEHVYTLVKDEDVQYELMNAMYSKFARNKVEVLKAILESIEKTYPEDIANEAVTLKDLCNCTFKDIHYYLDSNLNRRVPVRQEVLDIEMGIFAITEKVRNFDFKPEPN